MSDHNDLYQAAKDAKSRAHAPYSKFRVGAALTSSSGQVFVGANVENASYPEGWCAETSAIAAMIMAGEDKITEVCVVGSSKEAITPCGGCRQRLAEFSKADTLVHIGNDAGITRTFTLGELLPEAFDKAALDA